MYGYGYSAYNRLSFLSGLDPSASAFIAATAITDPTIKTAINTLVVEMKGYGIWNKMKAIYPFVGGTASTHKFNLKDPRDLDAAFRLAFNGGVTHNSNGMQGNGTNGFANSFLIPNAILSQNNVHLSIYSRTNLAAVSFDCGSASVGITNGLYFTTRSNDNNGYYTSNGVQFMTPSTSSVGSFMLNRTASNLSKVFKNGVVNITSSLVSTGLSTSSICFSGLNINNSVSFFRAGFYSFATIGDGLTDPEAANFYTAVQKFQTTLSRQV